MLKNYVKIAWRISLSTVTALLIIFQSVRAANANPVNSLRSE